MINFYGPIILRAPSGPGPWTCVMTVTFLIWDLVTMQAFVRSPRRESAFVSDTWYSPCKFLALFLGQRDS